MNLLFSVFSDPLILFSGVLSCCFLQLCVFCFYSIESTPDPEPPRLPVWMFWKIYFIYSCHYMLFIFPCEFVFLQTLIIFSDFSLFLQI